MTEGLTIIVALIIILALALAVILTMALNEITEEIRAFNQTITTSSNHVALTIDNKYIPIPLHGELSDIARSAQDIKDTLSQALDQNRQFVGG